MLYLTFKGTKVMNTHHSKYWIVVANTSKVKIFASNQHNDYTELTTVDLADRIIKQVYTK